MTLASSPLLDSGARRRFFRLAACCLVGLGLAFAQTPARAQAVVSTDELMAAQALPDLPEGSPNAPVTIIEYASMTCVHCAAFHDQTWPTLKAKYVDTGKAKFVLREFPLDPLAAAAFMLARCAGPEKRNAIVDLLYTQQKQWAFVEKPLESLAGLLKQAGQSQADFESCLKNQPLYDQVRQERDHAGSVFKVAATPTFFINGHRLSGELPIGEFDKVIEPLLK